MREMCRQAMSQTCEALAEKYGFDAEEAARSLDMDELKLTRKRGPSPKADKPVKTKAKKEVDPEKPKRAKTGYLLFSAHERADARKALEEAAEAGEAVAAKAVVTELARMWSLANKDHWNAEAAKLKDDAEYTVNTEAPAEAEAEAEAPAEVEAKEPKKAKNAAKPKKAKKAKEPVPEPEPKSDEEDFELMIEENGD
jgi:hypothetical protein